MTPEIEWVSEDLWHSINGSWSLAEPPFPEFPHRYYVGKISLERFDEIVAWLRENTTDRVIHNFDAFEVRMRRRRRQSDGWHTVFALMDESAAFAFKLRWSAPIGPF